MGRCPWIMICWAATSTRDGAVAAMATTPTRPATTCARRYMLDGSWTSVACRWRPQHRRPGWRLGLPREGGTGQDSLGSSNWHSRRSGHVHTGKPRPTRAPDHVDRRRRGTRRPRCRLRRSSAGGISPCTARGAITRPGSRCGPRATFTWSASSWAAAAAPGRCRLVEFADGKVRFSIPPQWDKRPDNETYEATLSGDTLEGWTTDRTGKRLTFMRQARAITCPHRHADLGRSGEAHDPFELARTRQGVDDFRTTASRQPGEGRQPGLHAELQRLHAPRRVPPAEGQQQRHLPPRPLRGADRRQRCRRAAAQSYRRDLWVPGAHVGRAAPAGRVADLRYHPGRPHRDRGVQRPARHLPSARFPASRAGRSTATRDRRGPACCRRGPRRHRVPRTSRFARRGRHWMDATDCWYARYRVSVAAARSSAAISRASCSDTRAPSPVAIASATPGSSSGA